MPSQFTTMNSAPTHTTLTILNRPSSRIVSAAMLMKDGHIVVGIRHFSPEMRKTLARLYPRNWFIRMIGARNTYHLQVKEQGFVDQFGAFHDREAAWVIAQAAGQIRQVSGQVGTLYSEDLY